MTALLQVLPEWETSGVIAPSPRAHLVDLTKRLTGDVDGERNGFDQLQCSSPGGLLEKHYVGNGAQQKSPAEKDSSNGDKVMTKEATDAGFSRPRSQPDDVHSLTSSRDSTAARKPDSRVCNALPKLNRHSPVVHSAQNSFKSTKIRHRFRFCILYDFEKAIKKDEGGQKVEIPDTSH